MIPGLALGLALWSAWGQEPDPRTEIEEARTEERSVLGELNEIDRGLEEVQIELRGLQDRAAELESSRIRHADEAASASARLDRLKGEVGSHLRLTYRLRRRGLARIVFGAEDPADLRRSVHYLMAILDSDRSRLEQLKEAADTRKGTVEAVEADLSAWSAMRAELQLKEADLKDQRARRLSLLDELRTRREVALRALRELADSQTSLSSQLGGGSYPASAGSSGQNFRAAYGRLPWPTTGRLVGRFGPRIDGRTGQQVDSKGVDIAADYGTPIRAVFPGVVSLAGFIRGYGQTVAVTHGDYTSIYAHANGVRVRKNQQVSTGDVLALVGNSGLTDSDGYLLSFEIRYNGTPQDPLPWLAPR